MVADPTQVEKLDVGLSQRPSRFDRKYSFNAPEYEERLDYCRHWKYVVATAFDGHPQADKRFSRKLTNTPLALLDDASQARIASLTAGFSFAYLKEAYISALLSLARRTATQSDNESEVFATLLQRQVETLRAEMSVQDVYK
jgi:transitional endoplasmic reticulum ATPase